MAIRSVAMDSYVGSFMVASGTTVSEGQLVGLNSSNKLVLADCDGGVEAIGFAFLGHELGFSGGSTSGNPFQPQFVSVYRRGVLDGQSGLSPGATYFLSTTAGAFSTGETAPGVGYMNQSVGVAQDASTMLFNVTCNPIKGQDGASNESIRVR